MNLLLLPGNSKRNKTWIREVEQVFADMFESTVIHDYTHWDTGQEFADLDLETSRLRNEIANLTPYIIFAKSIGSILATRGVAEEILQPTACVFAGFPLTILDEQELEEASRWLSAVRVPVLIIQNDDDPMGSWEKVSMYIESLKQSNIHIVAHAGSTHDSRVIRSMRLSCGDYIPKSINVNYAPRGSWTIVKPIVA